MLSFILFALMLISLGNLLYFKAAGVIILVRVFKAVTSISFVAIAAASYKHSPKNRKYFSFMFIGFIFSLFGDIFLSHDNNGLFFILGLGSFSLAHVLYIIAFCCLVDFMREDIWTASIIAIPTICFIIFKDGFDYKGMFPLVILYAILISTMVAKAFSLLKIKKGNILPIALIISGAILFFISDFILLFDFFYITKISILTYLNLIIYYLGQGLLAISFMKEINVKRH